MKTYQETPKSIHCSSDIRVCRIIMNVDEINAIAMSADLAHEISRPLRAASAIAGGRTCETISQSHQLRPKGNHIVHGHAKIARPRLIRTNDNIAVSLHRG